MSDIQLPVAIIPDATQPTATNTASKGRVWSRSDVKRFVEVEVHIPEIYPTSGPDAFEPWGFKLRFSLSKEQDEKRQDFLALTPVKQEEGYKANALDEICDLLIELPTGFGELQSIASNPGNAGQLFRNYVSETTDKEARQQLDTIVTAASNIYWNRVLPRSFRRTV